MNEMTHDEQVPRRGPVRSLVNMVSRRQGTHYGCHRVSADVVLWIILTQSEWITALDA